MQCLSKYVRYNLRNRTVLIFFIHLSQKKKNLAVHTCRGCATFPLGCVADCATTADAGSFWAVSNLVIFIIHLWFQRWTNDRPRLLWLWHKAIRLNVFLLLVCSTYIKVWKSSFSSNAMMPTAQVDFVAPEIITIGMLLIHVNSEYFFLRYQRL